MRLWLVCAILAACSDKGAPAQPPVIDPPKHDDRPPVAVAVDPGGMHLDEDVGRRAVDPMPSHNTGRAIDITLRSTPTGAAAAVDGVPVGTTPTYWAGQVDGRKHEFTFELHGFALARYRFVPVTSGVVHARLERIEPPSEDTGAGLPPDFAPAPPNAGAALVNPPPAPISPRADAPLPPPVMIDGSTGLGPQP